MKAITIALLLCCSISSNSAELTGEVTRIKDGDSLYVWNTEIRLVDIDAFERSQQCVRNGKTYPCGELATDALTAIVLGKEIRCQGDKVDRYERLLATCYADDVNINRAMVAAGWAVNYKDGDRYPHAQANAKLAKQGVWAGDFMDPYTYRRKSRADARAEPEFARNEARDEECVIKGNINTKGDKIYHTPWGSNSYKRTRISLKYGERWFCTEVEAEAAGWRAPNTR